MAGQTLPSVSTFRAENASPPPASPAEDQRDDDDPQPARHCSAPRHRFTRAAEGFEIVKHRGSGRRHARQAQNRRPSATRRAGPARKGWRDHEPHPRSRVVREGKPRHAHLALSNGGARDAAASAIASAEDTATCQLRLPSQASAAERKPTQHDVISPSTYPRAAGRHGAERWRAARQVKQRRRPSGHRALPGLQKACLRKM